MPRNLDVYLQQNLVGQLVLDHHGELNFQYADQWLNQPATMALSHSLPLRPARYNRKMAMKLGVNTTLIKSPQNILINWRRRLPWPGRS